MELGHYCGYHAPVNTHCDRMECASSIPVLREYGLVPYGLMLAEDLAIACLLALKTELLYTKVGRSNYYWGKLALIR